MSGSGGKPSRMSRSGRETLPDALECLESPPKCPGVVGNTSRMTGRVRKALPNVREALWNVREWLGGPFGSLEGPPACSGVVWRPSRMSLRGESPFWMAVSGRKAIPNVRVWFGGPPR